MLDHNNHLRSTEKLSHHKLSIELTRAAQDHAQYMAEQHNMQAEEFEHRGHNGSPGRRAGKYNYRGIVQENLARGYSDIDQVFAAWKVSPDHWKAITSNTLDAGFGYAVANDGTTYWVSVYGIQEPQKFDPSFLLISSNARLFTK